VPSYDYRCLKCKTRFTVFMSYSEYEKKPVACPHCNSNEVQRRIGRIRVLRSEDSRMDQLADLDNLDGIEEDPRSLGKMMRQMKGEVGDELGPEFDEVVDRLEKGQSPEDIERELPDLGMDDGGMGAGPEDFDPD
jgi:putative FmdB family regulatory protein